MNLVKELRAVVRGEVDDSEETLVRCSRDWSLFQVTPKAVVFPKDEQDIESLVSFASANRVSLTCRSGGSDMTGGPLSDSIVLDMQKYFRGIQEIGKDFAVVQPGVWYRDFEKETLKHNLILPSYPASRDLCTIGGIVANNSGGEKSLAYGKTDKYVQELRVVLADGKVHTIRPLSKEEFEVKKKEDGFEGDMYRKVFALVEEHREVIRNAKPKVSKNSSGYALWDVWDGNTFDLTKLFVGSQGSLGIITQARLHLVPPEKYSALLVMFVHDTSLLSRIIEKIGPKKPESFECYDDRALKLALRFLGDFLRILKLSNVLSLAWRFLPEFKMFLFGGLPKLVLLAEFTGDSFLGAQRKAREAAQGLAGIPISWRVTKNEEEEEKYFAIRRASFQLLHEHPQGKTAAAFIDDIIVKPEDLPRFLSRLQSLLEPYEDDIIYTIAGHIGDANFHIIPLIDLKNPEAKMIIIELMERVHHLVFEFGGSMSAEHNDGLLRTPFVSEMYGEKVYELFLKVKDIFDPLRIFNPGKKVEGDIKFAFHHIAP
ncbi:MAG: FAD-binding oxidoreductase [bacterium]|nr:FAD-binding oxidoreductase [bacterium]